MKMPGTVALLTSNDGRKLPAEIFLRIAEILVASEPKAIRSLSLTCRPFSVLLRNYQRSVIHTITHNGVNLTYYNSAQDEIILSRIPSSLGSRTVRSHTYPWLCEMRCRQETVEYLVDHRVTDMCDWDQSMNWPTLDVPEEDLMQRLASFKRDAFLLLYRLADCIAGLENFNDINQVRATQGRFLDDLSEYDLASIGVMIEVIGVGYLTFTKEMLCSSELGKTMAAQSPPVSTINAAPSSPQSLVSMPSPVGLTPSYLSEDLMNDNWIRETMCVFEDLTQRYGPYFAYAYLSGLGNRSPSNKWAREELQQGIDNSNAFELGYTMAFASLQSVVWKIYCRKRGCTVADSWAEAKADVEELMAGMGPVTKA